METQEGHGTVTETLESHGTVMETQESHGTVNGDSREPWNSKRRLKRAMEQ